MRCGKGATVTAEQSDAPLWSQNMPPQFSKLTTDSKSSAANQIFSICPAVAEICPASVFFSAQR
jgi:hypothetical protein